MKKLFLICISFVVVNLVKAQAPQGLNYQAVARNAQGQPLNNQGVSVKFSILNGSANGTAVYVENHTATTNAYGLFNLTIGQGVATTGTFSGIDWSNGTKFLKVEINNTLVGTTQFLSVPYALNAGNGSKWDNFNNNMGISSKTLSKYRVNIGTQALGPFPQRMGIKGITVDWNPGYNGYTSLMGFYSKDDELVWNYALNRNNDLLMTATGVSDGTIVLGRNGFTGLSTVGLSAFDFSPKARFHIQSGDIYLENATNGVIMKSPNGNCWRMTVSNTGQPVYTGITCPN